MQQKVIASPAEHVEVPLTLTVHPGVYLLDVEVFDSLATTSTTIVLAVEPDTEAPALADVPADRVVETTSADGAVVTFASPTATDTCSPAVPVSVSPPSGSLFPIGKTIVTCAATDAVGNTTRATFAVTVVQTGLPPEPETITWSGVLNPINPDGSSVFKVNRVLPVRFRLTRASAGMTDLAARFTRVLINNTVGGAVNSDATNAKSDRRRPVPLRPGYSGVLLQLEHQRIKRRNL